MDCIVHGVVESDTTEGLSLSYLSSKLSKKILKLNALRICYNFFSYSIQTFPFIPNCALLILLDILFLIEGPQNYKFGFHKTWILHYLLLCSVLLCFVFCK